MADVTASMVIAQMQTLMGGDWRYQFGGEVSSYPNDPAKKRIDCSEATEVSVRWAAESVGSPVRLTDGSFAQHDACYKAGRLVPLAQARETPGSLVFLSRVNNVTPGMGRAGIYHVGLVMSPALVLEACCQNGDVIRPVSWSKRSWYKMGGLIPGVVYEEAPVTPPVIPPVTPEPPSTYQLTFDGGGAMSLRYLKVGVAGGDVRGWQGILNQKFGARLTADGQFGPKTKTATVNAQKSMGVGADGIVGPTTMEKAWER